MIITELEKTDGIKFCCMFLSSFYNNKAPNNKLIWAIWQFLERKCQTFEIKAGCLFRLKTVCSWSIFKISQTNIYWVNHFQNYRENYWKKVITLVTISKDKTVKSSYSNHLKNLLFKGCNCLPGYRQSF